MKNILLSLFLIPAQVSLGQDCNTQAASKPSQFERWQDNYSDHLDVYSESREDNTRTEIVAINPAYFSKGLGRDMPQLIAVTVIKGRYPHMLKVARLIKQAGALAPLEELLRIK